MMDRIPRLRGYVWYTFCLGLVIWQSDWNSRAAVDLVPTYVASHLLMEGNAASIYSHRPLLEKNEAWESVEARYQLPASETSFVYPPAYLFVLAPLITSITFEQLRTIVLLLNVFSVAWLLWLCLSGGRVRYPEPLRLFFFLILCSSDVVRDLIALGQNSAWVAVLLVQYVVAWRRRRTVRAVLIFAVFCMLKPWGILLLILSFRRPRLLLVQAGAVAVVSVISLASFPVLSRDFIVHVAQHGHHAILAYNNISTAATLARFLQPDWFADYRHWVPVPWNAAVLLVSTGTGALILGLSFLAKDRFLLRGWLFALPFLLSTYWNHYAICAYPFVFRWLLRRRERTAHLWLLLLLLPAHIDSAIIANIFVPWLPEMYPVVGPRIIAFAIFFGTIVIGRYWSGSFSRIDASAVLLAARWFGSSAPKTVLPARPRRVSGG